MTISNIWKERELSCLNQKAKEHLKENLKHELVGGCGCENCNINLKNRQSLKLILQALVEREEEGKATHVWNMGGQAWSDEEYRVAIEGHNSAKQDTIDYLKSELTKLE